PEPHFSSCNIPHRHRTVKRKSRINPDFCFLAPVPLIRRILRPTLAVTGQAVAPALGSSVPLPEQAEAPFDNNLAERAI
ncbi:MAG: hypothetical protein L6Q93_16900, partial [Phycisphaerae bacterium]|nr:hypothetical protein [Phycisphaerae bacterium]